VNPDFDKLTRFLGYEFKDGQLLKTALTHRSLGKNNNERLEFLGDSILGWIIAEALYQQFPFAKEGQLSRLRARLIKGQTLAKIAAEFNLGDYLRLGQGELKSGGFRRVSTLADALEAIIGAIYLDSDIDTCRRVVLSWFNNRLEGLSLASNLKDPKTLLQEYLQAHKYALPDYQVISTTGKEHEQVFKVVCRVDPLSKEVMGKGSSRRFAEQDAAHKILITLGVDI
jgi:ribonuclease-3